MLHQKYSLSKSNGFLPEYDPIDMLPAQYRSWDVLAHDLPDLLIAERLRSEIIKTPILEVNKLKNHAELERAMLVLSFLAHAYLRGQQPELSNITPSLAKPWHAIAKRLDRPPILAHASAVLNNWRRLDSSLPISIDNIALLQSYQGGQDEAWFFLITVAIEKEGASIINTIVNILTTDIVTAESLLQIEEALKIMTTLLLRLPEKCEPAIFYNRLRPFLASFNQVIFEGVSSQSLSLSGGSAAQSSLIQSVDALLGIKHDNPEVSNFLFQMRKFMPLDHRRFIEHIELSNISEKLRHSRFGDAIEKMKLELSNFRKAHLKIFHRYVASQKKKSNLGDTGTGGTDASTFLKQTLNDTK